MNKSGRDILIFSQVLAGKLLIEGCKLLKVVPNKNNPELSVFYFPNTGFVRHKASKYINLDNN
ncbi:hypothetical protein ACJ2A9_04940 [Anaerobacillus sp. MEB173]|uniref:hypothetical protein n=1 Tax=Anaerobacillus sp. MEB173 TaxID=3383345 RepID=UPI003F902B84